MPEAPQGAWSFVPFRSPNLTCLQVVIIAILVIRTNGEHMLSSAVATQVMSMRMQGFSEVLRGLLALQLFTRCHIEPTPTFYSCNTVNYFEAPSLLFVG